MILRNGATNKRIAQTKQWDGIFLKEPTLKQQPAEKIWIQMEATDKATHERERGRKGMKLSQGNRGKEINFPFRAGSQLQGQPRRQNTASLSIHLLLASQLRIAAQTHPRILLFTYLVYIWRRPNCRKNSMPRRCGTVSMQRQQQQYYPVYLAVAQWRHQMNLGSMATVAQTNKYTFIQSGETQRQMCVIVGDQLIDLANKSSCGMHACI